MDMPPYPPEQPLTPRPKRRLVLFVGGKNPPNSTRICQISITEHIDKTRANRFNTNTDALMSFVYVTSKEVDGAKKKG